VRPMKRRTAVLAAIVCCLVAPTGVATAGPPTGEPAAAAPADRSALLDTAAGESVTAGGRQPDTYGGTWVDRTNGVVNVGVTSPAADRAALAGSTAPDLVRLVPVVRTWAELGAVRDRVLRDASGLRAAGIDLRAFYPKASTNRVVLEVDGLTAAQASLLSRRYGAAAVTVTPVTDKEVTLAYDRLNDNSPWNGGDFITSRYEGTCTSGPPGYRQADGRKFIITAGHCFPASRAVYNLRNVPAPEVGGGGRVGTVVYNDFPTYGGLDAAIIDTEAYGGSSPLAWRSDTVTAAQQSWVNPAENTKVCSSGAYELEVCNATVTDVDMCYWIADEDDVETYHCHISRAVNYNTVLAGSGDSGGPVYSVDTGTLKLVVKGIVTATGTQRPCIRYAIPNRKCSSIMYFTNIVPILQKYGMALNR
jgi:hypothetical protein